MPQVTSDTRTAFVAAMKATGFRRQKSYWVLPREETTIAVHLQRSQFSKRCFFNVGLWFNSLGDPEVPWRAPIVARADDFLPQRREWIDALLNDNNDLTLADRQSRLQGLVEELLVALVPWETLDGIRDAWPTYGYLYTVVAQKALGLPAYRPPEETQQ